MLLLKSTVELRAVIIGFVSSIALFSMQPTLALARVPYAMQIVPSDRTAAGDVIVTEVTNSRVPTASVGLTLRLSPAPPPGTTVVWISPDGKNEIGNGFHVADSSGLRWSASVDDSVGVYEVHGKRGPATIVAQVGSPVNRSATITVRDVASFGFGCYFFVGGPSIRFSNDEAVHTSVGDADVAVVGPAGELSPGPGYGCYGDAVDNVATTYRVVFPHGGRIYGSGSPFRGQLPFSDVVSASDLEVRAADASTYLMHFQLGGPTYFTGWFEKLVTTGTRP